MANRTYLYSLNFNPARKEEVAERKIVGLSEMNYAIPLVFQVLLKGNPQMTRSCIWDYDGDIAIIGNYDEGLAELKKFREYIASLQFEQRDTIIAGLDEGIAFLSNNANRNPYIIMEAGEIFEMGTESLVEQNEMLYGEICAMNWKTEFDSLCKEVVAPTQKQGFFKSLFGKAEAPVAPTRQMRKGWEIELGGDFWTNVLYFDPQP